MFFDTTVINHTRVVTETNHFATERKQKHTPHIKYARLSVWQNFTDVDMKTFTDTIINIGLHPYPAITDYFSDFWVIFSETYFPEIVYFFYAVVQSLYYLS